MDNILLLDDDKKLLRLNEAILSDELKGYKFWCFYTPEEALNFLENNDVKIAILDFNLGNGKNSLEVATKIQDQSLVIFLTVHEGEETLQKTLVKKNSAYFVKPINPAQILLTIKRFEFLNQCYDINEDPLFDLNFFSDFIFGFSHEVINPLTVAIGNVKRHIKNEGGSQKLETALEKMTLITEKISCFNSLFQSEGGDISSECYQKVLQTGCREAGIELTIHNEELSLNVPHYLFNSIITALIQNTIEFNLNQKKNVEIFAEKEKGYLALHYKDNAQELNGSSRIFNPFRSSKKNPVYNIGMGLTKAKINTLALGGDLTLSNKEDYKFKILLPMKENGT